MTSTAEKNHFLLLRCAQCLSIIENPTVADLLTLECCHMICDDCIEGQSASDAVYCCTTCGKRGLLGASAPDVQLKRIVSHHHSRVKPKAPAMNAGRLESMYRYRQPYDECEHLALIEKPRRCEHCDLDFCEPCHVRHLEVIRLEIGWIGHRIQRRYGHAFVCLSDMTGGLSNMTNCPEYARPHVMKWIMGGQLDWEGNVLKFFEDDSILLSSPESLIVFYTKLVKRDKEVWCLQQIFEPEVEPYADSSNPEEALSTATSFTGDDGNMYYRWEFEDLKHLPLNYRPFEVVRFEEAIYNADLEELRQIFDDPKLPEACKNLMKSHQWFVEFDEGDGPCRIFGNALHHSVSFNHLDVVSYLVEEQVAGLNVPAPYWHSSNTRPLPIHIAAAHGHLDVLKYLIERDPRQVDAVDSIGQTPLITAVTFAATDIIKYLLTEKSASIEHVDILGGSALTHAFATHVMLDVEGNEIEADMIRFLIENCFDGITKQKLAGQALAWAVYFNQIDLVKLILSRCPDLATTVVSHKDLSLLQIASLYGHAELADYLLTNFSDLRLNYGVEYWGPEDGRTALHCAASKGKLEVAKMLVEKWKADVAARSQFNETPADLAAKHGYGDVAAYLQGRTAASIVQNNSLEENQAGNAASS